MPANEGELSYPSCIPTGINAEIRSLPEPVKSMVSAFDERLAHLGKKSGLS